MWETLISELQRSGELAEFERAYGSAFDGYVVDMSSELVLISVVRAGHFDGATLIQLDDVESVRWGNARLRAWAGLVRESPTAPDRMGHIDVGSWATTIATVDEDVACVHIDSYTRFCALNPRVRGELLEANEIADDGSIDGTFAVELSEIVRIDFGGAWERSLERLVRRQTATR